MTVAEIMSGNVFAVAASATVYQTAELMAHNRVRCVVAMKGQRLRGLITDRDLVIRVVAKHRDPATTTIQQVLEEIQPAGANWPVVYPSTDTLDAAKLMARHHLRRLPVLENDEVVGIVSIADLASELVRVLEAILAAVSH